MNENNDNKVMVHCQKGVSRSVSVVMAYLLKIKNDENKILKDDIDQQIEQTLKEIQEQRPIAGPNEGFIQKLKEYVMELNNYND